MERASRWRAPVAELKIRPLALVCAFLVWAAAWTHAGLDILQLTRFKSNEVSCPYDYDYDYDYYNRVSQSLSDPGNNAMYDPKKFSEKFCLSFVRDGGKIAVPYLIVFICLWCAEIAVSCKSTLFRERPLRGFLVGVFRALEAYAIVTVHDPTDPERLKLLVRTKIIKATAYALQALLLLYQVMYVVSSTYCPCTAELSALRALLVHKSLGAKLIMGIFSSGLGFMFVMLYTPHTAFSLQDKGYKGAFMQETRAHFWSRELWVGYVLKGTFDWITLNLPVLLFAMLHLAMNIVWFALLGAIQGTRAMILVIAGKLIIEAAVQVYTSWPTNFSDSYCLALAWRVAVSSIMTFPWEPIVVDDDPAATKGSNAAGSEAAAEATTSRALEILARCWASSRQYLLRYPLISIAALVMGIEAYQGDLKVASILKGDNAFSFYKIPADKNLGTIIIIFVFLQLVFLLIGVALTWRRCESVKQPAGASLPPPPKEVALVVALPEAVGVSTVNCVC